MKTPSDFRNQAEWQEHLRRTVKPENVAFHSALGRTEMFREFYAIRGVTFPDRFSNALAEIETVEEPERTQRMGALNDSILEDLIQCLSAALGTGRVPERTYPSSSRDLITELKEHLRKQNPYFALWSRFRETQVCGRCDLEWRDVVIQVVGAGEESEIEFAHLVAGLGSCLEQYSDRDLPLPKHFYFQVWFLHRTREPERSPMARALLQELIEGLGSCGSA